MREEWRGIKDYKGLYQVSNTGKVKSLERTVRCARGYKIVPEKILEGYDNGNGYLYVKLCKEGKRKQYRINRLVAQAFLENPQNLPEVNHKDKIRTNNHVENLEWVTKSENTFHAYHNDLIKNHRKIKCVNTGEVFNSVADACRWCGLSIWSRSIKELLDGNENRKTAGRHPVTKEKLTWELI